MRTPPGIPTPAARSHAHTLLNLHRQWRAVGCPRTGSLSTGTKRHARLLAEETGIRRWTVPGMVRVARGAA